MGRSFRRKTKYSTSKFFDVNAIPMTVVMALEVFECQKCGKFLIKHPDEDFDLDNQVATCNEYVVGEVMDGRNVPILYYFSLFIL